MEAHPFRVILSRHGELLTFDHATGGVRFGDLLSSAANVGLAPDSDIVAHTDTERAGAPASARLSGDPRCARHASGPFATLSIAGEEHTVLLADGGLLATLRDLVTATWLRQAAPDQPGSDRLLRGVGWTRDFVPDLAGMPIDLAASLDLLTRPADPDALYVLDPEARIERLLRYDPVVAYTAFGPNMALFRCLEASLYSLSRVARFGGRVLILSDRERADIEFLVPGEMRPRTHHARLAAPDVMAMTLARYRLPTLPVARLARPLLYVDTDVIFDAPIEPLLAQVRLARQLCVFAEDDLRHELDFYGARLIAADGSFTPRNERGFSTGVIGIPDTGHAAEPFRALLALAEAEFARTGSRAPTSAFDQRFANYLFHKLLDYDDTTINRYETYCNGRDPDPADRRGLAHFAGGVGNAEPKLARMTAYLAALQRADG